MIQVLLMIVGIYVGSQWVQRHKGSAVYLDSGLWFVIVFLSGCVWLWSSFS